MSDLKRKCDAAPDDVAKRVKSECQTSDANDQPGSVLPLFEDDVPTAFAKCQDLVRKRRIFLSEEELLTLSALELIAGVKNGPAWDFAHHWLPKFEERHTAEWVKIRWVERCDPERAMCLYLASCTDKFSSDSHFFYVTVPYENSPCILQITQNCITTLNVKDKKEERIICHLDDIHLVEIEDDLIALVIEKETDAKPTFEILQSKDEEISEIFDTFQRFVEKSNRIKSPQKKLEFLRKEAKDNLEFIKWQERVRRRQVHLMQLAMLHLAAFEMESEIENGPARAIAQRNFDDFEEMLKVKDSFRVTIQDYIRMCKERYGGGHSQYFYAYSTPDQIQTVLEIQRDGTIKVDMYYILPRNVEFDKDCIKGRWMHCDAHMPSKYMAFQSKELPEIYRVIRKFKN